MAAVTLAKSQPVLIIGEQGEQDRQARLCPTPAPTNYEQYLSRQPTGTIAVNFVNAAHRTSSMCTLTRRARAAAWPRRRRSGWRSNT